MAQLLWEWDDWDGWDERREREEEIGQRIGGRLERGKKKWLGWRVDSERGWVGEEGTEGTEMTGGYCTLSETYDILLQNFHLIAHS